MGRPINKKHFGNDANSIKVQFRPAGSAQEYNGYIIKQLVTKKFRVTNTDVVADGTVTADCKLSAADSGSLAAGDMTITVRTDAAPPNNIVQILKITAHQIVDENGVTYPWTFTQDNTDNKVEIEDVTTDDFAADDAEVVDNNL